MADRLHLQPKHRRVLEALLREHLPGVEVWAYGSRVSGKSHDGSDFDLVLRGPGLKEIAIGQLGDFEEAVRESTIPFLIEARDWARLPERFYREIERDHVVLAKKEMNRGVDEWQTKIFADAPVEIIDGDRGKNYPGQQDFFKDEYCLFLNAGNVTSNGFDFSSCMFITSEKDQSLRKGKLRREDIVLTTRGTVGNSAHFDHSISYDHIRINSGMVIFRAEVNTLIAPYLYFFVRSQSFLSQIAALRTGSAQPQLPIRDINRVSIPIPPLTEQRAIAHILGTLDNKIELNRRMNETLEAMARALFKSWFVDFDPVRAKMAGREPYLEPEIWDLFPDSLDKDGKPEGWQTTELGNRVEILDSKRVPLSSRERQKRQGRFPYHGAVGVLDYVDDYLFDGVHVLLGEDGSVIKTDSTPFTQYVWGRFWVNNHAHVLKGKGISNELLFCFLNQVYIAPFVTGAVQPKLNQKNLKSILFSPADSRVTAYLQVALGPLFEQLRAITEQSRTLTTLRDILLPKLISGDIRIREAEKAVEAVA